MKIGNLRWPTGLCALLLIPAVGLAGGHRDDDDDDDDDNEIPFAEAHVFFELNNTDGDLGIHALIDGDPWKRLKIEDQKERRILDVKVRGRLRRQGLTEIFFESAEPPFDELLPKEFFARFPEGTYDIEGRTLDGDELESETEISHAMPAPPKITSFEYDTNCDDDAFTEVSEPVVIAWDPVTTTHPDLGSPRAGPISIYNYQVVVEVEVGDDEFPSVLSVILPPEENSLTIPPEFIAQGDEFKYEVLAREQSYNQTATESCFVLE